MTSAYAAMLAARVFSHAPVNGLLSQALTVDR